TVFVAGSRQISRFPAEVPVPRRLCLMGALKTAPVLRGFTLHDRFEAGPLSLRQLRQELGQAQILRLARELQLELPGFEHCTGAFHGEL
ncbi:MAG: hypothetical protein ACRD15_16485, partial [Vicinamibacterales bacterium]